jgi:outer membrane protein assembly factor BamB
MNTLRAALAAALVAGPAAAADWPQWRGAKRDGATAEAVEPWKGDLTPAWSAKVGFGYSTPVVAAGRVFVHARVDGKEREEMIAFDAKTGKELWRTAYDREAYSSQLNTGPQATPTVAGGKVYGYGVTGVLTAFDAETGKIVWQNDTSKTLKARRPQFGCCCSPVVVGNMVVVAVGGTGSSVVAFDAKTGDVAWRALDEAANTSSPVVYAAKGKSVPDVVFMTTLRVVGLNPLDGTVGWEYPLPFQPSGTAPTPLLAGDLAVTSTMDNGTTGIKLAPGDPEKAWQAKGLAGYFSSGVAAKGKLFLVTNVLKPIPRADLACVDAATGKELWKKNGVGYFHFGVVRTANDKLVILDDSGRLKLIDAAAGEYRELCSAKVCGGNLVTPAVADGCAFVRDAEQVVCVRLTPTP